MFFFSSRRRHTRSLCDWSSDVCSSDLDGFVEMVGDEVARSGQFAAVVIGPVTAQAARDAGMGDLVMAARSSVEGLAERSEERRVGKECRPPGAAERGKTKTGTRSDV